MSWICNDEGDDRGCRHKANSAEGHEGHGCETEHVHVQHPGESRQAQRGEEGKEKHAEGFPTLSLNLYPRLPS